ncbi:leucine-rich repeat and immunoglobulin-like domain-containing nogo receptor-interacting protein 1-B [Lineus longissimus]|uniref:leucine-rich repeat and immunoglobulin-like domain-containing nogo receptor-interacting protein 1-B n=1 Tax=Lineus longissimus TaxID=88925 RepID=UPI002B4C3A92
MHVQFGYVQAVFLLILMAPVGTDRGPKCPIEFACNCREILNLDNDTELSIDCNDQMFRGIPEFPRSLRGAVIRELSIRRNFLDNLPDKLFKGLDLQIEEIIFDNNPIRSVDSLAFAALKSVKTISFRNCLLKDIPLIFNNVAGLKTIYLSSNLITHIRRDTFSGSQLKTLDLSKNPLQFTHDMFDSIRHSLEKLLLDHLNLLAIPNSSLENFKHLRSLSLMFNKIHILKKVNVRRLPKTLRFLSFMGNNISHIESGAFDDVIAHREVAYLGLGYNNLQTLDFINEPCLYRQVDVSVYDNPINCDCGLFNLTRHKLFRILGDCTAPAKFAGYDIMHEPIFHGRSAFTQAVIPDCNETLPMGYYDCDCHWVNTTSDRIEPLICARASRASNAISTHADVLFIFVLAILSSTFL